VPQGVASLCMGLCITGLLCELMPGLTALRLKLLGSKSSSRRRFLLTLCVISAAVGPVPGCGVADRDGDDMSGSDVLRVLGIGGVGESNSKSSLIPEEEPRGRNCGGGVRFFSSVKFSQNSLPFELRIACCLKLLERPDEISVIISSSGIPSKESCVGPRLGDECVVVKEGFRVSSRSTSTSLSRVWRTTSASRRTSVSTGALSSASAARIRAKPLVLG
jgi:hypothetical protein